MREKGKGIVVFAPEENNGLPLNREQTDVTHRKWFINVKGENPCKNEVFNFSWVSQLGEPKGAFGCWTSIL